MKRAMFFDFDGTLVGLNISYDKGKIFEIFESYNFKPDREGPITPQISQFRQIVKGGEALTHLFNLIKELEKPFLKKIKGESKILQNLFRLLKKRKFLIIIISRNHTETIKIALKKLDIFADKIFGIDNISKTKPTVDKKILNYVKRNQIDIKKSFIIGDTYHDMYFGKELGLKKVLIKNPKLKKHYTKEADFAIKTIEELIHILPL